MFKVDLNDIDSLKNLNENLESGLHQEDPENNILINEALISESLDQVELSEFLNDTAEINKLINMGLLSEKTIVRLDKKAKYEKAIAQAEIAIAKEKNDRDYKKLVTVYKLKRFLLDRIHKRYYNQAKARVKANSHSFSLSNTKLGKKISK